MGTEAREGGARAPLVRRAAQTIATAVDPNAPPSQRRAALGRTIVGAAAVGAGGISGVDGLSSLASHHAAVVGVMEHSVAVPAVAGLGVGLAAAGATTLVAMAAAVDRSVAHYGPERTAARTWLGRIEGAAVVVGGAAGILGVGLAGLDATHLLHSVPLDQALGTVTAASAGGVVAFDAGRRLIGIGLPNQGAHIGE
jgi:hypothetical protein